MVAPDSVHIGCIAISREAKAVRVKTSTLACDARALVHDMIFLVAHADVYVQLHSCVLTVIKTIVPIQDVKSIDEVVCALLPSEARQCLALAARIKAALAEELSSVLICSIGIALTELLAKIAAQRHKLNGTLVLDPKMLLDALAYLKLSELSGLGDGTVS